MRLSRLVRDRERGRAGRDLRLVERDRVVLLGRGDVAGVAAARIAAARCDRYREHQRQRRHERARRQGHRTLLAPGPLPKCAAVYGPPRRRCRS